MFKSTAVYSAASPHACTRRFGATTEDAEGSRATQSTTMSTVEQAGELPAAQVGIAGSRDDLGYSPPVLPLPRAPSSLLKRCGGDLVFPWRNTRKHTHAGASRGFFFSFFLGFRRPNLITGLSGRRTPD